jgi:hypothetical protein
MDYVTFYNQGGTPIAWVADNASIFLFGGEPVGWIDGEFVYSYSGRYLGWMQDGGCLTVQEIAHSSLLKQMADPPNQLVKPDQHAVRVVQGRREVRVKAVQRGLHDRQRGQH